MVALCKLFLVALVTAAALWTAAEAHEVEFAQASAEAYEIELLQVYEDEFIQSQISETDEPRVCEPPSDGAWVVSDSLLGSPVYHFNMSAVTESVYQGTGFSTVAILHDPRTPLTLAAQFVRETCVFAGSIILERTNTVVSFVWSMIDETRMAGTGLRVDDGVLESTTPLRQTATLTQ